MLGKDHINISIAFVLPFIIPFLFLNLDGVEFMVVFLICVFIGSLLPDADCGGKATIYYRYPMIDKFMKVVVGKSVIFLVNFFVTKKKIETEYEIKDEHRGIIHSPVGVLLTSLMFVIPITIFVLIFRLFNLFFILAVFFGLIIGQLLHLFEDSCTISGINWFFPFKTREMKGGIYTFSTDPEKKDIRPIIFAGFFYLLILLVVLGYLIEILTHFNIFIVFSMILTYQATALFLISLLSKSRSSFWMFKKITLRKIKKYFRNIGRTY